MASIKSLEAKIDSLANDIFSLGVNLVLNKLRVEEKTIYGIMDIKNLPTSFQLKYQKLVIACLEWVNHPDSYFAKDGGDLNEVLMSAINLSLCNYDFTKQTAFINFLSANLSGLRKNYKNEEMAGKIYGGGRKTLSKSMIKLLKISEKCGKDVTSPDFISAATTLGYTEEEVKKLLKGYKNNSVVSLDAPVGNEDDAGNLGDFLADGRNYGDFENPSSDEIREKLFSCMDEFYCKNAHGRNNKSIVCSFEMLKLMNPDRWEDIAATVKKYAFARDFSDVIKRLVEMGGVDFSALTVTEYISKIQEIDAEISITKTKMSDVKKDLTDCLQKNEDLKELYSSLN